LEVFRKKKLSSIQNKPLGILSPKEKETSPTMDATEKTLVKLFASSDCVKECLIAAYNISELNL
jgi:hypothetical protein